MNSCQASFIEQEGFKKLVFRRCNSLLDVERKKLVCVPINSSQTSLDSCAVSCEVERVQPETPDNLVLSGGESDNDVLSGTDGSCFSPVETVIGDCLSPVGVNRVGRLFQMEAQLSECLSPVETPLVDGLFHMEAHVGRSAHVFSGDVKAGRGYGSSKDSNRDSVCSSVVESESKSLFRRRKSGSGQFRLSEVNKEMTLLDTTTKKRGPVFRRKSSLVEEDRKPVTKKIFGTSKTSLQLLRKVGYR